MIIHLLVDDVDAISKSAINAGAEAIFQVKGQPYGKASGSLHHRFGHVWLPATKIEGLSTAQLRKHEEEYLKENSGK